MKKWIICLLALMLVLTGCNEAPPQQTTLPTAAPTTEPATEPSTEPTVPTEPLPSLYVPGSDLEKLTRGSVQVFVPEEEWIGGYGFMGEDIVLFTYGDEFNRAMRISGADGTVLVDTVLEGSLNTWGFCTSIGENRMVFYDETDMCCVILDGSFQEIDRVALPEELAGIPLVSSDLSTVYYQVGDELRALNLSTGIPRLVLKLTGYGIYPSGLLMNDTVINCYVVDENGNSRDEFFSTETGESLGWDEALLASSSWDDRYMILRHEGAINRIVLGDAEGNLQEFVPEWDETQVEAHPCADALTQITYQENGIRLSAYEMETGNRRATVMLPGVYDLYSVHEDPTGEYIWCVVTEPGTGREMLARWDYTKSGGADSVQRIGEYYTADNPDFAGLEACRREIQRLEEKFNIHILFWDEPKAPEDYAFLHEYQPRAFQLGLANLESALSRFPEGFFATTASVSNNGFITVGLVREIYGTGYNTVSDVTGLQYWLDGSAYIAMPVSHDMESTFYHELCHVLDNYVYVYSIHYDFWEDLNPAGFVYDYSYTEYDNHYGDPLLSGENQAFIDAYSMTYPHEDRARVMQYAMQEGYEDYFVSDTMQAKLRQLCLGIREAFGWEKHEGTFVWEQYLREPLAYTKKK